MMIAPTHRALLTAIIFLLTVLPLEREVFGQGAPPGSSPTSVTNQDVETRGSATSTTEVVDATASVNEPVSWYTSEMLSVNIEVGDFVVGPGRMEIRIEPGETVVQTITLTNRISDNRSFRLEVEDITGTADGSSAVSLTGQERGPYSIQDYIILPDTELTLALGERARIPITISVPPDAEPGGFYGSVLVSTIQSPDSNNVPAPRSPLVARVGSLFFVTVAGDVEEGGQTLEISTLNDQSWFESGPIEMGILYENTGSIHLNPYGELMVTNMFGEQVGFVELEPWFVLPESLRVREVTWDREFLLGRYTVQASINRGYEDMVDKVSVSFWVLPWKLVTGLLVSVFIIIFGIRAFFRTFEFKRK